MRFFLLSQCIIKFDNGLFKLYTRVMENNCGAQFVAKQKNFLRFCLESLDSPSHLLKLNMELKILLKAKLQIEK